MRSSASRVSPKNSRPAAVVQVDRQGENRLRSRFNVSKKTVLTWAEKFWGRNPGLPQNQSSSRRRREFQDPQFLQGRTSNPQASSLPTLQAPWKRIELIQSWYSREKSVLLIGFIQCQSMFTLYGELVNEANLKKCIFLLKSCCSIFWANLMSGLISKWLDFLWEVASLKPKQWWERVLSFQKVSADLHPKPSTPTLSREVKRKKLSIKGL